MEKKITSHIQKGCIVAITYILFNTVITFAKLTNAQWTDFVAWFIIIVGTLLSVHLFGKQHQNNQHFGSLFSHGFKTAAVATCFIFIYILIKVYLFDKQCIFDFAVSMAKSQDAKVNEKIFLTNLQSKPENIRRFSLLYISMKIMSILFLGMIGSLVGAVATPKQNLQTK
ncbi:MAG: DUF4199 domain-containing protein [Bacteroidetes bacterium]|nr:DUF4199 domain-containing protein [Bacteroidota bacterium]